MACTTDNRNSRIMRIAFVSEIPGQGKVPNTFPNMRTECAWMHALNADHHNIVYAVMNKTVKDYDHVFIVFPKGKTYLSAEGSKLSEEANPASPLITPELIKLLRAGNNKKYTTYKKDLTGGLTIMKLTIKLISIICYTNAIQSLHIMNLIKHTMKDYFQVR